MLSHYSVFVHRYSIVLEHGSHYLAAHQCAFKIKSCLKALFIPDTIHETWHIVLSLKLQSRALMGSWDRKLSLCYFKGLFHTFLLKKQHTVCLKRVIALHSYFHFGLCSFKFLFTLLRRFDEELHTCFTILIISSSCLQAVSNHSTRNYNVAYIAYLCSWGWHSIFWPRCSLEEHFLSHLQWSHL